jgi:large subunit ribosomal protein L10
MARPEKVAKVNEVAAQFDASAATVLTEYSGLSVADLADLRRRLRESGADYKVVKNTLTRLAARKAGVEIPDELLTGPTAITFCADDPVAAAKVLRSFSKDHPGLVIKAGIVEGSLLDAAETTRLADLESREELLAKLAGMFGTVLAQPARLALANLEKAARLFAALQDKKPAESSAPAQTEAADTDGEAPDAEPETAAAPAGEGSTE